MHVLNVIEYAMGNQCTSLLCGTKTGDTWCVDIIFVYKSIGHVQNCVTYCVRSTVYAWTCYMLCFGTSIETCNRLSIIMLCKVFYIASIRLNEHDQNMV